MILWHFIYFCGKFHTDTMNQTVFGKEFIKLHVVRKMKTIWSHLKHAHLYKSIKNFVALWMNYNNSRVRTWLTITTMQSSLLYNFSEWLLYHAEEGGQLLIKDNLVLSTGLIMWIGHYKEIWKLTFQTLALHWSKSMKHCMLYSSLSVTLDRSQCTKLNSSKVQQLCFECQFKDLMGGYGICCFVIFFHSVCTTSSTITPTWRAWLLLQPGWFRGCLWFIWHSKPGYCISITWSHGILIMMHFTSTIVLPVKHVIQYGLKHSHGCACDCSESQVAWILYGFAI